MSISQAPAVGAKGAGVDKSRGVNDLGHSLKRKSNKYNLGQRNYVSGRFSEVIPIDCHEVIPNQYVGMASDVNLMMNRPLVSPMFTDVFLNRLFCSVSGEAIYPESWHAQRGHSISGDSVCPPDASSRVDIGLIWSLLLSSAKALQSVPIANFASVFYCILACANFLRADGILPRLGICNTDNQHKSYDAVDELLDALGNFDVDWNPLPALGAIPSAFKGVQDAPAWLDFLYSSSLKTSSDWVKIWTPLQTPLVAIVKAWYDKYSSLKLQFHSVNLAPFFGYKLAEAEFFTVDNVDDIWSAERFTAVMKDFVLTYFDLYGSDSFKSSFKFDNVNVLYDWSSSHYWSRILQYLSTNLIAGNWSFSDSIVPYVCLLFFPTFSLKYGDYFTGGRLQPLASGIGDTIPVNGSIDTMDINASLLQCKLRQYINQVGSRFDDQMRMLFGITPAPGGKTPKYIAHVRHLLNKSLVVSTADTSAEGTDSNLGSLSANINVADTMTKQFCVTFDDFGYCYQLLYTEAKNCYPYSTKPFAFKRDRDDYYNPVFENMGDMAVLAECLDPSVAIFASDDLYSGSQDGADIFSYASQYTDYREDFNRANGAFCTDPNLQSWYYLPDLRGDGGVYARHLDSHFLRHQPYTFDKFFGGSTHYGSKGYHFLLDVQNVFNSYSSVSLYSDILFNGR